METSIERIKQFEGKEVKIKGWLYNKRSSGKILFLLVRDGTGIVQCTLVSGEIEDRIFQIAERLNQESSIIVSGEVRADKRAIDGYEIFVTNLEVIQIALDYPLGPKEHGIGFLMKHRHLWLRSKRQHAILRIRSEVIQALRDFFYEKDFVCVDSPIFTPNACEGTTTLFETDYFGEKAYLSQSGQLYNEASCMAFGKVYCFGPCFRAEKSKTRRHLAELWMLEPEVAFAKLDDIMKLAEEMIVYLVERVISKRKKEILILKRDISCLEKIKTPFPRISYDEAVKILEQRGVNFSWGEDFGSGDETILSNAFEVPFFVHNYPAQVKAFYMKRDPERPEVVLNMDMLAPEGYGEIIGGGEREDNIDILKKRIEDEKLQEDAFGWYLDLRKFGSVPHGGYGIGIERTVTWICGLEHIRESVPFPRMLEQLYP